MDTPHCSVFGKIRSDFESTDKCKELNEKYEKKLWPEIREKWKVPKEHLNMTSANGYTDTYWTAYFDQRLTEGYELSPEGQDLINQYMGDRYGYEFFLLDQATRVASHKFI